jgi:predicted ABC-type ATPase
VFAGPNGSGKSSIFDLIQTQFGVGVYVNADALERQLATPEGVALASFHPSLRCDDFEAFYFTHPLHAQSRTHFPFTVGADGGTLTWSGGKAVLHRSYAAAILADYLRQRLVEAGVDVSFETVLSHPSKLDLMRQAKALGYRVYLYYVCVASPEISKQRVAIRVSQGGHAVPEDKIVERYYRSLGLLADAIACSDRAYLFDNTYAKASLKLEVTQGHDVVLHHSLLPEWIASNLKKSTN